MLWRKQRDTWLFNEKNFAYTALFGVAKWHLYKQLRSFFNHIKSSNTNVSLFIIASLMNRLNTSLLRILMIGRKAIHWIISRCQYSDDSCSASIIVAADPHVIHIGKIFRLTTTTSIWQTVPANNMHHNVFWHDLHRKTAKDQFSVSLLVVSV